MVSVRTVTGEEAGSRDVDEPTGAEGPGRSAVVSSAVPEAPLLADTAGGWEAGK